MAEEDIYSAPKAELSDSNSADSGTRFFPTSQTKLLILYLSTLGVYSIYWFYKNWKLHKEITGENIYPAPRALFYIFFTHSLFRKIEEASVAKDIVKSWGANALATVFVILTIISNILERFTKNTETIGMVDYVGLALLVALVWPLYIVQDVVNKINDDPKGKLNNSYSIYNYIFIFLGFLIWSLVIIGIFEIDVSFIVDMLIE